jgi:carboxylesterase type B
VFHSVPSSEERHIPSWACSVTLFDDPLQRIRTGQIARVPTLLGTTEDDGTVFALLYPNVSTFLVNQFGPIGNTFPPAELQALYPKMNDTQLLDAVVRDVLFQWCATMVSPSVREEVLINEC